MSVVDSQSISEATAKTEVTQVVLRERESRDLCWWNRMRDCFHPDAQVSISWFQGNGHDFVTASKGMAEKGTLAKHRLGPVLVTLNGSRAVATLTAIIDIPTLIGEVELVLSAHCLLLYRVEKRQGQWRIYGFNVVYRRDELTPAIIGQKVDIPPGVLEKFRPSYRNLCYSLYLNGFHTSQDLPGEDRPDTAKAIMEEVYQWAGMDMPS